MRDKKIRLTKEVKSNTNSIADLIEKSLEHISPKLWDEILLYKALLEYQKGNYKTTLNYLDIVKANINKELGKYS